MKVSVIVCTYKNPTLLQECLQSLVNQEFPAADYEILVIDNNSQDSTPKVVDDFSGDYPNIKYFFEANQGLSYARNRGIQEAKGEIVAFTDDDAIIEKQWVSSLYHAFSTSDDIWAVGGKTLPLWRTERPEWIDDILLISLSIREYGEQARDLVWPERLIGVNCSFRKEIFSEIGYFDPSLGRKGDVLFDQEDIEIQKSIFNRGKRIFYTPQAVVWHIITGERTTPQYFMKRTYGTFRTFSLLDSRQSKVVYLRQVLDHFFKLPGSYLYYRFDENNRKKQKEYIVHKAYTDQAIENFWVALRKDN